MAAGVVGCGGPGPDPPRIRLDARLAAQPKRLVPVGDVSIAGARTVGFTAGANTSTIRLDDGTTVDFSRRALRDDEAAAASLPPDPLDRRSQEPTTHVELMVGRRAISARSPRPVPLEQLDDLARTLVALPASVAGALVEGRAIASIVDEFVLGGVRFRRTLTTPGGGPPHGASLHLGQKVEVVDHGDLDDDPATVSGNVDDIGMDLANAYAAELLAFRHDGTFHWLVSLRPGSTPRVLGHDVMPTVVDELTGLRYGLVTDADGDERAALRIPTAGRTRITRFSEVAP
jgi:hypothetical protein